MLLKALFAGQTAVIIADDPALQFLRPRADLLPRGSSLRPATTRWRRRRRASVFTGAR
jgi:hypothetical protein